MLTEIGRLGLPQAIKETTVNSASELRSNLHNGRMNDSVFRKNRHKRMARPVEFGTRYHKLGLRA